MINMLNRSRMRSVAPYLIAMLIGMSVGYFASLRLGSGVYRYQYLLSPVEIGSLTSAEINQIRSDLNQATMIKRTIDFFEGFEKNLSITEFLHYQIFARQSLYQLNQVPSSPDSWIMEVISPFQIPSRDLHQFLHAWVHDKTLFSQDFEGFDTEILARRLEILKQKEYLMEKYLGVARDQLTVELIDQFNRYFPTSSYYDILLLKKAELSEAKLTDLEQDRQQFQELLIDENQQKRLFADETSRVTLWQKFQDSLNDTFNIRRVDSASNVTVVSNPDQMITMAFSIGISLLIAFIWQQRRYLKD